MRISDWSSYVCSSDLILLGLQRPNTDRPCRLDRFRHLLSKTTEMGKPNSRTTRQHEPPPRYHGEQKSLRVLLRFVMRRPLLLTEASAEEPQASRGHCSEQPQCAAMGADTRCRARQI